MIKCLLFFLYRIESYKQKSLVQLLPNCKALLEDKGKVRCQTKEEEVECPREAKLSATKSASQRI